MRRSSEQILASHAGVLPRPGDLEALSEKLPTTSETFEARLPSAVSELVRMQLDRGVHVVNDGEISKSQRFSRYIRDRMKGFEQRTGEKSSRRRSADDRDERLFPRFYVDGAGSRIRRAPEDAFVVVEPLAYIGQQQVKRDIDNLLAACKGLDVDPFLTGIAPGTVEHWLSNEYYPDTPSFLFALADVLNEEFRSIANAGIVVQIDDPDLLDGWQLFPDWDIRQYRDYAEVRVAALNRAIAGIPEELVRLHVCWGSQHGPHVGDIPLEEMIDLIYSVNSGCYSIEASNGRHEHEWRVFEKAGLPEGKILMPGVVGHASDIVEHPQAVADRIIRFASIVGRENVIAGTDCGLARRVGGPEICWAKLASLGQGASLASRSLWGRGL